MNSENRDIFDVFGMIKSYKCQTHQKKLELVCSDSNCPNLGLMCVDCLVSIHQGCKGNILKYQDFLQLLVKELRNQQATKHKRFEEAQLYLRKLSELLVEFNQVVIQEKQVTNLLNQQLETIMIQVKSADTESECLAKIYSQDRSEVEETVKAFLKQKQPRKFEEFKFRKNELDGLINGTVELLNEFPKLETLRMSESKDKKIKVKNMENLMATDTSIQRMKIQVGDEDWRGLENIMCKFINLQHLQIHAMQSPMKSEQLNQVISVAYQLPSLQKLDLNLISTFANESTLNLVFNILETKKIPEFGLLLGYSQIFPDNFIRHLKLHRSSLGGIRRFTLSNQLKEFSPAQLQQLKDCFSNIEIIQ